VQALRGWSEPESRMMPYPSLPGQTGKLDPAALVRTLLYTALFNTAIAVLLTIIGFSHSFLHTLLFAQCIGITICLFVLAAWSAAQARGSAMRTVLLGLALTLGALCGTALATALLGKPGGIVTIDSRFMWQIVGISLFFGAIITHFFYTREQLAAAAQLAQEERLMRLSSEKLALEASLQRLQAQVEPHFLFNTLSTIVSLMDRDPARAKTMQLDLIRYLRTTLGRTQAAETTLGQEMELIRAYLNLFSIRMEERLQYAIEVPEALHPLPLPPMLLQPIVENALLHGLEPKITGGRIHIRAARQQGQLAITVSDTGRGLDRQKGPGVGLTNVRERLARLYGNEGRLAITENETGGVTVVIEIPLTTAD
jgi:sensor histidine kinase YesM